MKQLQNPITKKVIEYAEKPLINGKFTIFKLKAEEIAPLRELIDHMNTPQYAQFQDIMRLFKEWRLNGVRMQKKDTETHLRECTNMAQQLTKSLFSYALEDVFHEVIKTCSWMPNIAEILSVQERVLNIKEYDWELQKIKTVAQKSLNYYNKQQQER